MKQREIMGKEMVLAKIRAWDATIVGLCSYVCPKKAVGIVELTTSDGIVGYGQFGNKDVDLSDELFHRRIAPAVMGKKLNDPWRLVKDVFVFDLNYKMMGCQFNKALAGLDGAVWDAAGKKFAKSVCELISGKPFYPFPVYGSSLSRKIGAEALAIELKTLHDATGIQIDAFKVKIGKRMQGEIGETKEEKELDQWPQRTEQILEKVRQVLPQIELLVDANGAYPSSGESDKIDSVCKLLVESNVKFLEEPFFWCNYDTYEAFPNDCNLDIALGEQEFRMDVWKRGLPAATVYQPDFGYCGGTSNALEIADLARKHGKRFVPHSPQGDLHLFFAFHIACACASEHGRIELACVNDGFRQVQFDMETGVIQSSVFEAQLRVQNGKIYVINENAHGWGFTIKPDWFVASTKRPFQSEEASKYVIGL